jgi:hypothetical protein
MEFAMLRKSLTFMMTLAFVGISTLSAQADLCFRYGSGGGTLVAKGATLPQPNECRTLSFFEDGSQKGAATGSICRDIDGTTVVFHYVYHSCLGPTYFETGTCRLGSVRDGIPEGGAGGSCRLTFNQTPRPDADTSPILFSGTQCSGLILREEIPSSICQGRAFRGMRE